MFYRAFTVVEMSEARNHSAELGNSKGALQAGSEEGQKKKREAKERKKKESTLVNSTSLST